jgi:hypothetical protein
MLVWKITTIFFSWKNSVGSSNTTDEDGPKKKK